MDDGPLLFGSQNNSTPDLAAQRMAVLERGIYRGPHYYSHTPMVRIMLDLGGWRNGRPTESRTSPTA
jgi:hypothetical protein